MSERLPDADATNPPRAGGVAGEVLLSATSWPAEPTQPPLFGTRRDPLVELVWHGRRIAASVGLV
jgi:hypothetical protein